MLDRPCLNHCITFLALLVLACISCMFESSLTPISWPIDGAAEGVDKSGAEGGGWALAVTGVTRSSPSTDLLFLAVVDILPAPRLMVPTTRLRVFRRLFLPSVSTDSFSSEVRGWDWLDEVGVTEPGDKSASSLSRPLVVTVGARERIPLIPPLMLPIRP